MKVMKWYKTLAKFNGQTSAVHTCQDDWTDTLNNHFELRHPTCHVHGICDYHEMGIE